jgi:hypothetical protein
MVAVFAAWNDEFGEEEVSASQVIERAEAHIYVPIPVGLSTRSETQYTHARLRNAIIPIAKKQGQLDGYALGIWLRKHKDRIVGVAVRMVTVEGAKHRGVAGWVLQRAA